MFPEKGGFERRGMGRMAVGITTKPGKGIVCFPGRDVSFNDALSTFHLRLYRVGHILNEQMNVTKTQTFSGYFGCQTSGMFKKVLCVCVCVCVL